MVKNDILMKPAPLFTEKQVCGERGTGDEMRGVLYVRSAAYHGDKAPFDEAALHRLRREQSAKRGSVEPQIDQKDRDVGRRNAADAGGLADGGGTLLGKLLCGLDAQPLDGTVVKCAWQRP